MVISTGEKFPYPNFSFRLELKEGKENRICWFECQEHVNRYLTRHKLKKKDYVLMIRE